MEKKVVKKENKELKFDRPLVSYIFGILAIVQAFFNPLAGVVLGILGLIFLKKEKGPLASEAKKLSIVGLIISSILTILQIGLIILNFYLQPALF